MRRVVLFEHMSLDGYLAGPGADMSWVRVDDEWWDYAAPIIDAAGTAIFGRITYQLMQAHWPSVADDPSAGPHDIHHSEWTKTATKLVFSKTLPAAPWDASGDATSFETTSPQSSANSARRPAKTSSCWAAPAWRAP